MERLVDLPVMGHTLEDYLYELQQHLSGLPADGWADYLAEHCPDPSVRGHEARAIVLLTAAATEFEAAHMRLYAAATKRRLG
jgi:hypothetical protein